MKRLSRRLICGLLILLAIHQAGTTSAQETGSGIIANGTAESSGKPEFLRMTMLVSSTGSDTQSAIESLIERKKKAAIKLEKLDVIEDSIKFGTITLGEPGGPGPDQMRAMMMRQLGQSPEAEKLMEVQPPLTATVTLTADWKVPEGENDAFLIACQQLKDQVLAADIGGAKEPDKLSPEQEELAAELSEMSSRYSSGDEASKDPTFMFCRRVSAEDLDSLMKQAFEDAKKKAEKLAQAASLQLGKLQSLTSRESASDYDYEYGPYGRQRSSSREVNEDGSIIVKSGDSKEVSVEVNVYASFEIK